MTELPLTQEMYVTVTDTSLDAIFYPAIKLPDDIEQWCRDNLSGSYECHARNFYLLEDGSFSFPRTIVFENESDAVLFKLRWCESASIE